MPSEWLRPRAPLVATPRQGLPGPISSRPARRGGRVHDHAQPVGQGAGREVQRDVAAVVDMGAASGPARAVMAASTAAAPAPATAAIGVTNTGRCARAARAIARATGPRSGQSASGRTGARSSAARPPVAAGAPRRPPPPAPRPPATACGWPSRRAIMSMGPCWRCSRPSAETPVEGPAPVMPGPSRSGAAGPASAPRRCRAPAAAPPGAPRATSSSAAPNPCDRRAPRSPQAAW
jgi:hypothetical protein